MKSICYSDARANLKTLMIEVCKSHAPILITSKRGLPVVLVSLADFNGFEATTHLLSSEKNAVRLAESIAQLPPVVGDPRIEDMAMLIKKLARHLDLFNPISAGLAERARDYLKRNNLMGSPLRDDE
jgi:antitoxin YefM